MIEFVFTEKLGLLFFLSFGLNSTEKISSLLIFPLLSQTAQVIA